MSCDQVVDTVQPGGGSGDVGGGHDGAPAEHHSCNEEIESLWIITLKRVMQLNFLLIKTSKNTLHIDLVL